MIKFLPAFLLLVFTVTAWACPGCDSAAAAKNQPPYTLYILGGFILMTYIPFYILFRATKKYDPKLIDGNE